MCILVRDLGWFQWFAAPQTERPVFRCRSAKCLEFLDFIITCSKQGRTETIEFANGITVV